MRDFFILWAERLIAVFVVLLALGVVGAAIGVMSQPAPKGGVGLGLLVLVLGLIYVTLIGGLMFVAFGIHRNTRQTNDLLQELLRRDRV